MNYGGAPAITTASAGVSIQNDHIDFCEET